MPDARKLILKNHLSPGDVLAMTAAVYSLHKANPGKFLTAVDTTANAFYENDPNVSLLAFAQSEKWEEVQMNYPLVNECNQRAVHFLQGYCDYLAYALKVQVPLATNRPTVYVSDQEKSWMNQVAEQIGYKGKFWLMNAGRKADYSAKFWGTLNFQRAVDLLKGKVVFVQVGAAEHHHPALSGVIDLRGKTDLRQLVRLCYHAEGVVTGVSMLMHLSAALEKPCVAIMGGREPVQWNSYPRQHLLHTIGALPCCKDGGCWRSRTVKLNDGAEQDNSLCDQPTLAAEPIPKCMSMLSPERVAESVEMYYAGGVLSR